MYRYSKLMRRVRIRNVNGEARQTIAGTVPEAVWTEMCGAINELTFSFNQITLDGFKVAGYVPVCNSLLEDNDVNLASWIVEMLSEAIGLAKDKAILYGKGAGQKMPLGIVTRLAQESKPSDYPANAPAWVDLHTSNIITIPTASTGEAFWAALAVAAGNTFTRYSRGERFWAMNSKTLATLQSKAILATALGRYVTFDGMTMPIIGGDVEILEFIPDGDIVGGYGDLYLWAQRSGMTIHFDVPDWVPVLGGKSLGFNIPTIGKIAYLAKGGILSSGSAIVGEAGPELLTMAGGRAHVMPLNGDAGRGGITIEMNNTFNGYDNAAGEAAARNLVQAVNRALGRAY